MTGADTARMGNGGTNRKMEKLINLVVKLAVLAAGVVLAMEALDVYRRREGARYLIDQEFTD
jgi:cytochrome c oxidase assembly factor CtaG